MYDTKHPNMAQYRAEDTLYALANGQTSFYPTTISTTTTTTSGNYYDGKENSKKVLHMSMQPMSAIATAICEQYKQKKAIAAATTGSAGSGIAMGEENMKNVSSSVIEEKGESPVLSVKVNLCVYVCLYMILH